jgi:hypothetical protein
MKSFRSHDVFCINEILSVVYVASEGSAPLSRVLDFTNRLPEDGWGKSGDNHDWKSLKRFFAWSVLLRSGAGQVYTIRAVMEKIVLEISRNRIVSNNFIRDLQSKLSSDKLEACFSEPVVIPATELGVRLTVKNSKIVRLIYTQALELCRAPQERDCLCIEQQKIAAGELAAVLNRMGRSRIYEISGNHFELPLIAKKILTHYGQNFTHSDKILIIDSWCGGPSRIFIASRDRKVDVSRRLDINIRNIGISRAGITYSQMKDFSENKRMLQGMCLDF